MQMGQTTGANMAYQQAQANQMNAQIAQNQALTDGLSNIAVAGVKGGAFSKQGGGSTPGDMSASQTIYDANGNPMSPR